MIDPAVFLAEASEFNMRFWPGVTAATICFFAFVLTRILPEWDANQRLKKYETRLHEQERRILGYELGDAIKTDLKDWLSLWAFNLCISAIVGIAASISDSDGFELAVWGWTGAGTVLGLTDWWYIRDSTDKLLQCFDLRVNGFQERFSPGSKA